MGINIESDFQAEDSAAVKKRIATARKHQRPNGPDSKGLELLRDYAEKCIMSARAYQNGIAVAATIAKLDGADKNCKQVDPVRRHFV
jgi:hypothetical protein